MRLRRTRIALAGLLLLLLLPLGGWLGLLLYSHLVIGIPLDNQPGLLRLPANFSASAEATEPLHIGLQGPVSAEVPLQQAISIPLRGSYSANVAFSTSLPLHFDLHYQGSIPVDTWADIQGDTRLVTGEHWFIPHFALKARIPVHLLLPVNIRQPLDTRLRLDYRGPVGLAFSQTLSAPVHTTLHARLRLNDDDVSAPVQASFPLRLHSPSHPVPMVIDRAKLLVSADNLRVTLDPGEHP